MEGFNSAAPTVLENASHGWWDDMDLQKAKFGRMSHDKLVASWSRESKVVQTIMEGGATISDSD